MTMAVSNARNESGVPGQRLGSSFSNHYDYSDRGKPGTLRVQCLRLPNHLLLESRIVDFEYCRPTNFAACISDSGCYS